MPAGEQTSLGYPVFVGAGLAGLAYVVALLLSYYFGGGFDQEANIWLASGVAIGLLALTDPVRWPAYLLGIALGALLGNLLSGADWIAALVYVLEELVVAAPAVWLLRRLPGSVRSGKPWDDLLHHA
jgi:integral membrane sensor domain MASE1